MRLALGTWNELRADAEALRRAVFVQEQGCDEAREWDEFDAPSLHCVAYLTGQPVGTGRLLPGGRIGRMAVSAAHRRRGIASRILRCLVSAAAARGDTELVLHAQVTAVAFYRRHGFDSEGDQFDEEGIAHLLMRRRLRSTREEP